MNFDHEKYEYLLKTWGGFYNEKFQRKHGLKPGYYWFNTENERKDMIDILRKIEKKYNAKHLVISCGEGKGVRYNTIAQMILIYNGKRYPYQNNFGYNFPAYTAIFQWEENNYSCDCNRSLFLQRKYGDKIKSLECGDSIIMKDLKILQVRCSHNDKFEFSE